MQLQKRIALITGGTKGIGAATALALAKVGADIALVARHGGEHATAIQRQVAALDRRCEVILADIGVPDEATRCVHEANQKLGPIDILVHAAGGPAPGNILEISAADWQRAFDVHVHAAFHLCRAALPAMREQRSGAIIFVSSAAGIRGCPGNTAYQVVKGALPQFARALARDFAPHNIRVNCVAPGVIRTAFHDAMTPEQQRNNLDNRIPLAREGSAEQVAELIKQLVTNEYVTGETVTIDGGLTMRIA
jgi:NAD(P)-dependent dehydrogenase (short-subunit alcohol dehydrogenase family)